MDLSEDRLTQLTKTPQRRGDEEIKRRFRILLREGIEGATQMGHAVEIEKLKLEDTHMWASLLCKKCGGILYIDADRKWHMDKIFGMAVMVNCIKKEE